MSADGRNRSCLQVARVSWEPLAVEGSVRHWPLYLLTYSPLECLVHASVTVPLQAYRMSAAPTQTAVQRQPGAVLDSAAGHVPSPRRAAAPRQVPGKQPQQTAEPVPAKGAGWVVLEAKPDGTCVVELAFTGQTADQDGDFVQAVLAEGQYEIIQP
jgi:hypothetical protein